MSIGSEIEKLAFLGALRGGMNTLGNFFKSPGVANAAKRVKDVGGEALSLGWHGAKDIEGGVNNWVTNTGNAFGVKNKILGKIPLPGAKTMTALGTAAQVPDALSEEDMTGQGRSRAERMLTLGAGTAGGLAGGSLTAKRNLGRFGNIAAPMAGSILGQTMAEKAVSVPFKPFRSGTKPMPGQLQPQTQSSTENLQLTGNIKN